MVKQTVELFADYVRFCLPDEAAAGDLSERWTPDVLTCPSPSPSVS